MLTRTVWAILAVSLLMNLSSCAESNMNLRNLAPHSTEKTAHPPAPDHNE